jgi:hypothetical protein
MCPPQLTKPPLGLMPRRVWDDLNPDPSELRRQMRRCDVEDAIARYAGASLDIPDEWLDEYEASRELRSGE